MNEGLLTPSNLMLLLPMHRHKSCSRSIDASPAGRRRMTDVSVLQVQGRWSSSFGHGNGCRHVELFVLLLVLLLLVVVVVVVTRERTVLRENSSEIQAEELQFQLCFSEFQLPELQFQPEELQFQPEELEFQQDSIERQLRANRECENSPSQLWHMPII
jgi:hypothetical protein